MQVRRQAKSQKRLGGTFVFYLTEGFLSSELFKNLIDGGTLFLNVLEEALDLVGTVPTLLAGFGTVELFKNLDWPVLGLNYKIA